MAQALRTSLRVAPSVSASQTRRSPAAASVAVAPASSSAALPSIARGALTLFAPSSNRLAPLAPRPQRASVASKATAQMSAATTNPLLEDAPLPAFDRIRAEHVVPGIRLVLAEVGAALDALEKTAAEIASSRDGSRVWPEVVEPLERLTDRLGRAWGSVSHLKAVKDSPELRAAVEEVQPERVAFSLRLSQSRPLFDALAALRADEAAFAQLSDARRRAVDAELRDFRLGGVALEGDDKKRFNEVQQELSKLSTQFSNNVLDATKAFKKLVTDPKVVEGLPPSALALASQQAAALPGGEHEGATPEKGPWLLTLDIPVYMPVLQHAKDRGLREEMYRAYVTRAASPKKKDEEKEEKKEGDEAAAASAAAASATVGSDGDNTKIIERTLALRKQKAALLGFDCFADLSMASKMATLESSRALLEKLAAAARAPAQRELEEVTAFAKSKGFPADEALKHWDVSFWAERLREERYELTDEQLRPYFSLPRVLEGLFTLVERLFGVVVEEEPQGTAPTWNKDVRYLKVSNKTTGKPIAFMFLDPYSRPDEKRGGAWMDEVVGRSIACATGDGDGEDEKVRLPVAHMVLNSTPPVGDKPSLMTFREVETLFHECGHALQHTLTKQDDGLVSGIRNVEWDAVELPSQWMEYWCYDRKTVDTMAVHHETGESLPDELFEKILKARTYRAGSMVLRQVNFALTDLFLHAEYDPAAHAATGGVYGSSKPLEDITAATTVMRPLEEDRFLAAFSHIFAGGYSAGYFSYLWAEVLSADCFGRFEEAGLDDEAAVKEAGRAFADTVLALGGGVAPAEVFKRFRGRDPTPDALLRHKGLVAAA